MCDIPGVAGTRPRSPAAPPMYLIAITPPAFPRSFCRSIDFPGPAVISSRELDSLAQSHAGKDPATAFAEAFDASLPENVNVSHRMLIVASEFDDSSERIVEYLVEEHHVNINAVFFSVFGGPGGKFLGRAWLTDPAGVETRTEKRKQAPWTGYWFVNVGKGPHRNWADNVRYGYIGAGQGPKYSQPLKKLKQGDTILAYMKGSLT